MLGPLRSSDAGEPKVAVALAGLLAVLAAIASATGLAVSALYHDAPYWIQQARGTDVATLVLAVPVLVIGLIVTRRDPSRGKLLVIAALLYLVYNYAIFAFAVRMNALSGLYIALLGSAVWSLALTLREVDPTELTRAIEYGVPHRSTAALLLGVSLLFGLMWASQIASATLTGTLPADLQRAAIPTNPVYALDLALFLPLCVAAAFGLLRSVPATSMFAVPMLLWLAMTSAGIVAGFWYSASAGEPAPVPVVALVSAIGLITGALATFVLARASRHAQSAAATSGRRVRPAVGDLS